MNGQEAIDMFKERVDLCIKSDWNIKPYTVMIIDYEMPVCNGPSAIA